MYSIETFTTHSKHFFLITASEHAISFCKNVFLENRPNCCQTFIFMKIACNVGQEPTQPHALRWMMDKPTSKPSTSAKQPANKRAHGQTGPITAAGKATSSRNAIKTGLHASWWIDHDEELEYQTLFQKLCDEYNAQSTTLLLQIERMASTMVKMRRLQKLRRRYFKKPEILRKCALKKNNQSHCLQAQHPRKQFWWPNLPRCRIWTDLLLCNAIKQA